MMICEAYEGSNIRLLESPEIPTGALEVKRGDILEYMYIDGMYAKCNDEAGNYYYISPWARVICIAPPARLSGSEVMKVAPW